MLKQLFGSIIKSGTLIVVLPGGRSLRFGEGKPEIGIRFHDSRAGLELASNPELKLGEIYMDGRLTLENGDIADLLDFFMHNLSLSRPPGMIRVAQAWRRVTRRLAQHNYSSRARKNVAHHYDLSAGLYDVFLDRDRQYSCLHRYHYPQHHSGCERQRYLLTPAGGKPQHLRHLDSAQQYQFRRSDLVHAVRRQRQQRRRR